MKNIWEIANLELIAKSLSELLYEEILIAEENDEYFIVHLKSGVNYQFTGLKGIWSFIQIDANSITRIPQSSQLLASQFFIDAQKDLELSQITLAHFIEEMNNTLYSEMKVIEKRGSIPTSALAEMSGEKIQSYLSGHPKILLNKGRLGFSANDLKQYAPENEGQFQLKWLALKKGSILEAISPVAPFSFTENILGPNDVQILKEDLLSHQADWNDYGLLPVHPWQFNRFIEVQYQNEIISKAIIPLSVVGPKYSPQISIRTLTNSDNRNNYDLKLSLTILNTSAYRGIAAESVEVGPALSEYLEKICQKDAVLKIASTTVLKEVYSASYIHPTFSQIKDSPYRYSELLGCVVRESAESKINDNEQAIMTGSLFYVGDDNQSLIGEYIKRSKLSPKDWMREYFKHVIIPLYHLQLDYGIGIVSHGQNIVLKLTNFVPSGVFLKDFQGDLRINKNFISLFPENLKQIKSLPPEYLIHDLITGHFVTVLRFISPILEKFNLLSEIEFYQTLRAEIEDYLNSFHPELKIENPVHLLRDEFEKVILNKVRFKIGYEDSAARPLPLLGKNLKNPLASQKGNSI